jgi:hypothetical protein
VLLPVDPAAYCAKEDHDRQGDPRAILLEEVLKLVATKVLVDFSQECVVAVRWDRQDCLKTK